MWILNAQKDMTSVSDERPDAQDRRNYVFGTWEGHHEDLEVELAQTQGQVIPGTNIVTHQPVSLRVVSAALQWANKYLVGVRVVLAQSSGAQCTVVIEPAATLYLYGNALVFNSKGVGVFPGPAHECVEIEAADLVGLGEARRHHARLLRMGLADDIFVWPSSTTNDNNSPPDDASVASAPVRRVSGPYFPKKKKQNNKGKPAAEATATAVVTSLDTAVVSPPTPKVVHTYPKPREVRRQEHAFNYALNDALWDGDDGTQALSGTQPLSQEEKHHGPPSPRRRRTATQSFGRLQQQQQREPSVALYDFDEVDNEFPVPPPPSATPQYVRYVSDETKEPANGRKRRVWPGTQQARPPSPAVAEETTTTLAHRLRNTSARQQAAFIRRMREKAARLKLLNNSNRRHTTLT